MKDKIYIIKLLLLTFAFTWGLNYARGWSPAAVGPTDGNAGGTLLENEIENVKTGPLMVNTGTQPTAVGLKVNRGTSIRSTVPDKTRIYLGEYGDGGGNYSGVEFQAASYFKGGIFKEGATDTISIWNSRQPVMSVSQDGLTEFAGQIRISGGNPGPGKILTSGADGLAYWDELAAPNPNLPPAYFGGMYSTDYTNPLANNTKSCPQGYVAHKVLGRSGYVAATESDWFWGGGDMESGTYGDRELFVCYGDPQVVSQVASFGGMYMKGDRPNNPNIYNRFRNADPYGGGWWCPEGFTESKVLGAYLSYDNPFYFCYSLDLNARWAFPFAGMYSRPFNYCSNPLAWDRYQGYYWGPYSCKAEGNWGTPLYNNPLTNGQSCPAGFGIMQVYGWLDSGGGSGVIGQDAQVFMCTVPAYIQDTTPDWDTNDTYP